ncbi:MAG: DUF4363 family protein [Clostridia bacterium]|nr:DUF4363 family protein [Clostridia bacterium]
MKRLIWAAGLSILLVAIVAYGKFTVKANCNELLSDIEICKNEQNKISAQQKAEILENKWIEKEPLLSVFINRNIVQEIGVHIALIHQNATEPDSLDYAAACAEAHVLITHAIKNQRLAF